MKKTLIILSFLISFICISSQSWALPNCPKDLQANRGVCFGIIKNQDGGDYEGEFKYNGSYSAAHGFGIKIFYSGSKYVGEFKNGNYNGKGIYTWANGKKYEGEWKNSSPNGQGKYTYSNGKIEEGIWKNNKFMYAKKIQKTKKKYAETSKPKSNKILNAASGTGFSISSKGHVITNYHVVKGCQNVKIHSKGKVIPATLISFDPKNDIALLKGNFTPSQVLPFSNKKTELLQDIYVAGYPFGRKVSTSVKVTKGIISSLTGVGNNFSNFQIDAALQPGNSGGPILNNKGNVIGVAVAKLSAKYIQKNFGVIPENTNFGIKTSVVKSMLDSTDIKLFNPNKTEISKTQLGKNISNATYYLSCWMTMAQIEQMRSTKVIFKNLE